MADWKPGLILTPDELTPAAIGLIKACLSPVHVVGITAWREAEARFEDGHWTPNPVEAMADIANIVNNRANDKRWSAKGYKGVCLARWQFSCWEPNGGPDDPKDIDTLAENFEVVMYAAQKLIAGVRPSGKLQACMGIAEGCVAGYMTDTLSNATHYYATWIAPPRWAQPPSRFIVERYGHRFYAGVA